MARILIIDDDEKIRVLLVRYLMRIGYTIAEADNGKTGMALLESFGPDLIITDILMPEMDGLEILMAIRKTNRTLPIIAISGGLREVPVNFLHHAKVMGAQYVFKKPFGMEALQAAIEDLLSETPDAGT